MDWWSSKGVSLTFICHLSWPLRLFTTSSVHFSIVHTSTRRQSEQRWLIVGPVSTASGQHWISIGTTVWHIYRDSACHPNKSVIARRKQTRGWNVKAMVRNLQSLNHLVVYRLLFALHMRTDDKSPLLYVYIVHFTYRTNDRTLHLLQWGRPIMRASPGIFSNKTDLIVNDINYTEILKSKLHNFHWM